MPLLGHLPPHTHRCLTFAATSCAPVRGEMESAGESSSCCRSIMLPSITISMELSSAAASRVR